MEVAVHWKGPSGLKKIAGHLFVGNMKEPTYRYIKGQGWVASYVQERRKQPSWDEDYGVICNGCGQPYGSHFGTKFDMNARCPMNGRAPEHDDENTLRFC